MNLTSFLRQSGRAYFGKQIEVACFMLSYTSYLALQTWIMMYSFFLVRFESKNRSSFHHCSLKLMLCETHNKEMLHPAKWGTHVELFAAATYFQIPVVVF